MVSSILPSMMIGLCLVAATINAYPLMNVPGNYYYYYPGGYYNPYYYYYGNQQMMPYADAQRTTPAIASVDAPQATIPGLPPIDIQRITEFFQSLFPFLKPSTPAPALPALTGTASATPPATATNVIPGTFYRYSPYYQSYQSPFQPMAGSGNFPYGGSPQDGSLMRFYNYPYQQYMANNPSPNTQSNVNNPNPAPTKVQAPAQTKD